MKRVCIVGAGAAALLLLLQLEQHSIDPSWITVVDPTHSGGDLAKKWRYIRSNTTWRQVFEAVPSRTSFAHPWSTFNPDESVELKHVIDYLRANVQAYYEKTIRKTDTVVHAEQEGSTWKLTLNHSKKPIVADLVFFTQGSDPKTLDLPFPSIPLDIALDPRRLSEFVQPNQHVMVFGTAHSGPFVVKNLIECGAKVTNFYATDQPFYFARDGHYDGIKQEAVPIADTILQGGYPLVSLESVHDLSAMIRASKTADACVYACGFEQRSISPLTSSYDGATGRILNSSNAWGFGIAYPNRASDGIHWDVSIPSFQRHIESQMSEILQCLNA